MKRGRKSKKRKQEEEYQELPPGTTSIRDVSDEILIDILSRLSVKLIFRCRSVCKLWLNLLLSPTFAKHHLSQSPTCPLLRDASELRVSAALYLVELERDTLCDVSDTSCDVRECYPLCDRHVNLKLRTVFMVPERECDSRFKARERRFDVVNSCNGFLCLRGAVNCYPIVIYNPVTGDYSVLPVPDEPYKDDDPWSISDGEGNASVGGLGFCHKTNQYKVLVMIFERIGNPRERNCVRRKMALVYTLGSGTWRRVGLAPYFKCGEACPAFLNGALHWFVDNFAKKRFIVSFDFETEQFHALPAPSTKFEGTEIDKLLEYDYDRPGFDLGLFQVKNRFLGVLRGCLYLSPAVDYRPIHLLIMKQYGVQDSWQEEYTGPFSKEKWPVGFNQPIDFLSNGDLLMYNEVNAIMTTDGCKFKYFKIRETMSKFEVIAHVPSFVSLKEVMGDHMKVLNVRSRLPNNGAVKMKAERLFLVEEDHRDMWSDSDCFSDSDDYQTETVTEKLEVSQTETVSEKLEVSQTETGPEKLEVSQTATAPEKLEVFQTETVFEMLEVSQTETAPEKLEVSQTETGPEKLEVSQTETGPEKLEVFQTGTVSEMLEVSQTETAPEMLEVSQTSTPSTPSLPG